MMTYKSYIFWQFLFTLTFAQLPQCKLQKIIVLYVIEYIQMIFIIKLILS